MLLKNVKIYYFCLKIRHTAQKVPNFDFLNPFRLRVTKIITNSQNVTARDIVTSHLHQNNMLYTVRGGEI